MAGNTGSILVTGGAGYIGSHACVSLLQAGYQVVVLDNFCNSQPSTLERVQQIAGKSLLLERCDIRDRAALDNVFNKHGISAVMHFAGLKAVGESCQQPLFYYENNVGGTINLLQAMQQVGVRRLIFSSSALGENHLILIDINEGITPRTYSLVKFLNKERCILVLNKIDKCDDFDSIEMIIAQINGLLRENLNVQFVEKNYNKIASLNVDF